MLLTTLVALLALDIVVQAVDLVEPPQFANCTTASWTFNAENQSPCMVAGYLIGACNSQVVPVAPLGVGLTYTNPTGQLTTCACSSVTYSMFSACAICQNGTPGPWSDWSAQCDSSRVSVASYPLSIPTNITVPTWAYLNVSRANTFDATAAQALAGKAPDSTGLAPTSSSTPSSPSSTGLASANSQTPSPSAAAAASHHSSNAGPIAGGVVGGLVFLALLAGGFFYYRRQSNKSGHAGEDRMEEYIISHPLDGGDASTVSGGTTEKSGLGIREIIVPGYNYHRAPTPKLYDPDDPSTFPPTPHPSIPGYSTSSSSTMSSPPAHSRTMSDDSIRSHPVSLIGSMTTGTQTQDQSHGRNLSDGTAGMSVIPEV